MSLLVTVVTPCYNSGKFIEETVQSVLGQTYPSIEYIVMDGNSTDETSAIIEKYRTRLHFVSERDHGQSDAINKGWRMAKGDIVAWLNADDTYFPDTVEQAVDYFETHPDAKWVYGYPTQTNEKGEPFPFRHPVSEWDYSKLLNRFNYIIQPSVFVRREVLAELGFIREDLHYCMDYEYWLRIGRVYPGHLVPSIKVKVKWYRNTKTSSGGSKRMQEILLMVQSYGALAFPSGMYHDWAEAYVEEFFKHLKERNIQALRGDIRALTKYPRGFPRGFAKYLINNYLSPDQETRLRQIVLRRDRYPD